MVGHGKFGNLCTFEHECYYMLVNPDPLVAVMFPWMVHRVCIFYVCKMARNRNSVSLADVGTQHSVLGWSILFCLETVKYARGVYDDSCPSCVDLTKFSLN